MATDSVVPDVGRMPESFGVRLRLQRERKQIPLSAIAEKTKISIALLEALERDDVSRWPGGIFRRAFIRAYAHAIDLAPDVAVREFLELYPDPEDIPATVSSPVPQVEGAPPEAPPPTRLRGLVGSAFASLSRLGRGFANRRGSIAQDLTIGAANSMAASPLPPSLPQLDLCAAADLCTELGCVCNTGDAARLLQGVAKTLDAVGLIIWVWDRQSTELRPFLAHGYPKKVLARLPRVGRDADNATATAFRSVHTCVVNGSDVASGAVAIPLMTRMGCVGVLGVELRNGGEQSESVRALATIFAAQLASLVAAPRPVDVVAPRR